MKIYDIEDTIVLKRFADGLYKDVLYYAISDYIDLTSVIINYSLNIEFCKFFRNQLDWFVISIIPDMSEEFIRIFADDVDWASISAHQKLSEEFIREFKDRVNWQMIVIFQSVSTEFTLEFGDFYQCETV